MTPARGGPGASTTGGAHRVPRCGGGEGGLSGYEGVSSIGSGALGDWGDSRLFSLLYLPRVPRLVFLTLCFPFCACAGSEKTVRGRGVDGGRVEEAELLAGSLGDRERLGWMGSLLVWIILALGTKAGLDRGL